MESEGCCNTTFYLSVVVFGLVAYIIYKQMTKDTWAKYGVKQLSMMKIMTKDFKQATNQILQEEGDTVGFEMGQKMLLTRDLNILKHVMVKDFNNFVDRAVLVKSNSPVEKGIFFLGGRDWKRVRHLITPSFSTGKIKLMVNFINDSGVKLASLLDTYAKKDDLLDIKKVMGQFTGEIIARTGFSLKTDCIGKATDDEFTTYSQTLFITPGRILNFFMVIMFQFKRLHTFLVKKMKVYLFDSVSKDADKYFKSILYNTMEDRKQLAKSGHKPYTDLFQSLISAKEAGDKEVINSSDSGSPTTDSSWDSLPKTMSEEELLGQCMFIIFAGFDTTATTLQMCSYYLAKHPEVDAKVYEEIQKVITSDLPTYEEILQLKYMEQVINETLRLCPPAPIMTRQALESKTYGSVTIPKGAGVIIPLDMVMRDPKNYPDPEKFDPERFSEQNILSRDPMAFMPFGYGPRQCIGMRLAIMELKLCLVHVLRKVKFELNERTEPKPGGELEILFNGVIFAKKPIMLAVKPRQK